MSLRRLKPEIRVTVTGNYWDKPGILVIAVRTANVYQKTVCDRYTGRPTHFLSHAWLYRFINLVTAQEDYVRAASGRAEAVLLGPVVDDRRLAEFRTSAH